MKYFLNLPDLDMRRFKSFVIKEVYHILRDWRTLLILIGMPIAQILLFGFAISNEISNVPMAYIDHSQSKLSREIIEQLEVSEYFTVNKRLLSEKEIEEGFRKGYYKQVVIFDDDFEKDLYRGESGKIQVIADASDPNTATLTYNYAKAIIQTYFNGLNTIGKLPFNVKISVDMKYNPELKGAFLFVPGTIAVILMLISAMMTSISITKEKELGTMEILLATPMAPAQIVIAKVVPYMVLSFTNAILILLLGFFVFQVPVVGNLALLLGETFLYLLTTLALGIFISSMTNSQQVALMGSLMGLMLPTILLSGFIFPIENMPAPLRLLSHVVPARYFMVIIKGVMIKGHGIEMFWKETLILIGFLIFFIGLSVRKFKIRLS